MSQSLFSIPEPEPLQNLLSLQGKCAVVTGGTRGIGKAIVRRFVEAGATVVFTGRNPDALKRAEEKFTAAGGKVLGVQADSGRIEDAKRVINLTVEKFGHIDILVNNTAVFPASTAMDMTEEIWDETFDVDTKGAFFFAKFAAEAMIASGRGGRIINILSTAAFQIASPLIAYGAAKASLWYITQAMAQELAKYHILVNAVTPGATLTAERIAALINGNLVESTLGSNVSETMKKMESTLKNKGIARMLSKLTPLGRPGYPDDIAKAVLFLASDMASYITGVNIIVDGGQTLKNERFDVDDDDESTTNTITHEQSTGGSDKLLEGTYKAIIKTPMGAQEVIFTFHVEDNILTGTVSALGNSFEIENGKVTADGFSFQYTIKAPIGKVKVHVNGKLDGDKILCNLKTFMGSIPFEGTRV